MGFFSTFYRQPHGNVPSLERGRGSDSNAPVNLNQSPHSAVQGGALRPAPISQHAILVSRRQHNNPVLKLIRNVRWQYADIIPDYMLGQNTCALFLSIRYHLLQPGYIHQRIAQLQRSFRLRVLLCHVDVDDAVKPLGDIIKIALVTECTLICAWSMKECARYLETYKSYESKPAHNIQERVDNDYTSRLNAALTEIKGVNKTDAGTLVSSLNSFAGIMRASKEDLSACPGIGPTKLQRLHDVFHQPLFSGRSNPHNRPQGRKLATNSESKETEQSREDTNPDVVGQGAPWERMHATEDGASAENDLQTSAAGEVVPASVDMSDQEDMEMPLEREEF